MAKSKKTKVDRTAELKAGRFVYCPDCGSRQKINGTCLACGATDAGKNKESVPDDSESRDTSE